MAREHDPRFSKRLVSRRLRGLRDQAERTQQDVADAMDWSVSKLIRIETATVGISISDLKALLMEYGVANGEAAALVAVAKEAKRQPWYASFGEAVSSSLRQLLVYESSAISISQFDIQVIPGLLQTEDYARALLALFHSDDQLDQAVEARMERQRRILDEEPPELRMIIDESVLGRAFGGPEVMGEQLEHLMALAERPGVLISVVPQSVGHIGVTGSFELLDVQVDGESETVLYVEERPEYLTSRDDELIKTYWGRFEDIEKVAESGDAARALLKRARGLLGTR